MLESQIKEEHYTYNQTVNVLWGKGKSAQYYKAKLMLCGMPFYIIDIISFYKNFFLFLPMLG